MGWGGIVEGIGWYGGGKGWCEAPLGQWQVTGKRPLNFFD